MLEMKLGFCKVAMRALWPSEAYWDSIYLLIPPTVHKREGGLGKKKVFKAPEDRGEEGGKRWVADLSFVPPLGFLGVLVASGPVSSIEDIWSRCPPPKRGLVPAVCSKLLFRLSLAGS